MSAGQSARRGYAYTVNAGRPKARTSHRSEELMSIIAAATVIFVIVAAMTDPVINAAVTRAFGTAWSDAVALLLKR
jgi:hypothetical protein